MFNLKHARMTLYTCMSEGNSQFCFPESPDVSQDEVEGNIKTRGKTKITSFPWEPTLHVRVLLYTGIQTFIQQKQTDGVRATTAQLYPGQDTFEFDQGHVTKNQQITVLILLSESLAI